MKNEDTNKLNATKPANSTGTIESSKLQGNASIPSAPIAPMHNETTIINSTVTRIPNNDAPAQLLSANNNATMSQAPLLISLSNSSKPFQNQNITTNDYANVTKGLVDQHPVAGANTSAATATHNETAPTVGPSVEPAAALSPKSDSKLASSDLESKNHQDAKTKKTEKPVKRSPSLMTSSHSKKTFDKAAKASTRTLRRSKPRSGVLRRSTYIIIIIIIMIQRNFYTPTSFHLKKSYSTFI